MRLRFLSVLAVLFVVACGDDATIQWSPAVPAAPGEVVPVFEVASCACDAARVRYLAELFGLPFVGVSDEAEAMIVQGAAGEVLVFHPRTGMFEYHGGPELDDPAYRTELDASAAEAFASALLASGGLLPVEAKLASVQPIFAKGALDGLPHHWEVRYDLHVTTETGLVAEVTGASITARVGDAALLGLVWHWRPLESGQTVPLRAATVPGGAATPRLVYALEGPESNQQQVFPYYVYEGATYARVLPASDATPDVSLERGGLTAAGEQVFSARITQGTPPFELVWRDADDGSLLGEGETLTVMPRPGFAVELVATDAAGLEARRSAAVPSGPGSPPSLPAAVVQGAPGPVSTHARALWGNQWSMTIDTGSLDDGHRDGLVLTNLRYNQNLLASRVSMPSYRLSTDGLPEQTCYLQPMGAPGPCWSWLLQDAVCWGSGMLDGKPCRSRNAADNPITTWIHHGKRQIDRKSLVVQAFYLVQGVSAVGCELFVVQTYVFSPPKKGCGDIVVSPDQKVPNAEGYDDLTDCASFYPLVDYFYVDAKTGAYCDGSGTAPSGWVGAFESAYRFDYDLGSGGRDYARYMDVDELLSAVSETQKKEGSYRMTDYGAVDGVPGDRDDLHQKSGDFGPVVVPTCDAGATALTCAHMHWRWPALAGLTEDDYAPNKVWAPGSQRVTANLVRYEAGSYASADPMALVNGETISSGFIAKPSDIETWVITRSDSARGRNAFGAENSGWSDQQNTNEWFFQ